MTYREQVAADWAKRGFSCDSGSTRQDSAGRIYHAMDELVIVLEGRMEFEIAGQVHHPESGRLLIPAGAVHSARNIGTTTAHCSMLQAMRWIGER